MNSRRDPTKPNTETATLHVVNRAGNPSCSCCESQPIDTDPRILAHMRLGIRAPTGARTPLYMPALEYDSSGFATVSLRELRLSESRLPVGFIPAGLGLANCADVAA